MAIGLSPIPTRYEFIMSQPLDRPEGGRTYSIKLELRNRQRNLWAIIINDVACLTNTGETETEPICSSRTEEFVARTRFTFEEALERARQYIVALESPESE